MGIFTKNQTKVANNVYEDMRPYLKAKDGRKHVLMINSFSKFVNINFACENKYTTQIDEILSNMQEEGYEIIDVKFNSLTNQGLMGQMEGFNTLVIYK